MKTVHVHHDGQYWRGFKHGLIAFAIAGVLLAMTAADRQPARAFSEAVNQAKPGLILPLPLWWRDPEAEKLKYDTIYDLDRHGLRPVPAAKAATCK